MQNSNPQSKSSTRKWIKSSMVQQYGSTCLWPGLLDFDINFRSVAWNSFQCKCLLKNLPYFSFSDDQMMAFYTCVTKRGFSFDMQSSRVYQVWVCHITVTIIRWFTLFLINFARTWHIMQKTKHNLELDSILLWGLASKLYTTWTGDISAIQIGLLLFGQVFSASCEIVIFSHL